jgi:hypothetical protein
MASNGKKFTELIALSSEEMAKLPITVRIEVKKWKQEELDRAIVWKKTTDDELGKAVVSLDSSIA